VAQGTNSLRSVRAAVKVIIACSALPRVAAAQNAEEQRPSLEPEIQVEELVVTARLREENLQEVPLSAVIIGEQLRTSQNLQSLGDLAQTIPSIHIGNNGRSNDLYIRGIGSGINSSFDQSVGTFIDGIYHGRSRFTAATFLDLDRLEILKGPQSTFFGNNSIAGAFNVVTAKPTRQFEASTRALYGDDGLYTVEGSASGPIGEKFAVRGAMTFNGMDGWLENVGAGPDAPKENNAAARISMLYSPSNALDVSLKAEGSRNRNQGAIPNQIANCPPPAPFTPGAFCNVARSLGVPIGIDANQASTNDGQEITLNTVESVLNVNFYRGGHTYTSISGYYNYQYNLNLDPDATPSLLFSAQVPERYHQASQEFRVASSTDQFVSYLVGVYYQKGELNNKQDSSFFFQNGPITARVPPLVPFLPLGQDISFSQDEDNYSAFASLTVNFSEKLKFSPGVRGTRVKKDFTGALTYGTATQMYGGIVPLPQNLQAVAGALGLGVPYARSLTRTDDAVQPSASIQYTFNDQAMVYSSYTRGFKAGGFNAADTSGVAANQPFDPEYVNAYEIGYKSKFLDNRVLFNIDLFRSDYDDLQVAALQQNAGGTFTSVVKNAAQSQSQGVELEGQFVLNRYFRVGAQATYLDAKYKSFPNASPSAIQQLNGALVQDLTDHTTQFAPHNSGSVSVAFTPMIASFQLTTELRGFYSSSYYLSGVDDDLLKQGSYTRLDARISLEQPGKGWGVDVVGKNLTDENILVLATPMATSLGGSLQQKEQPRNVAIQGRYRW
jgi:outer membrane receptor protein involved in Fe transport